MAKDSNVEDGNQQEEDHVVDFKKVREKKLEEKRRKTERIFFRQILGIYCVSEQERMREVELVDVSEEGLAFQLPFNPEDPWPSGVKDLNVRLYFSQDTYLPVQLQIANSRPTISDGERYIQYGCHVDKSVTAYEAYQQFVKFLKLFSQHAHQNKGKATHFYL